IDTHLTALKTMGARTLDSHGHALELADRLKPVSIYLEEASVTGTETALLAAACADGHSEIRHAATEPHVVELARFLSAMGAQIEGAGTSTITVDGVSRRRGVTHTLWGDYIDAGTWAVIGAITGGEVEIHGARAVDVEVAIAVMRRMNVACTFDDGWLRGEPSRLVAAEI